MCGFGIEKSVQMITVWHHKACRVITNSDPEGQIFLSHLHTNNGFFFLLNIKYRTLCYNQIRPLEVPEYTWYDDVTLTQQCSHLTTMCMSSNTTNVQPSSDSLGKITWVNKIFYPRVKSQISVSGVQILLSVMKEIEDLTWVLMFYWIY